MPGFKNGKIPPDYDGHEIPWIKGGDLPKIKQQIESEKSLYEIFRKVQADNAHIKGIDEIMCMAIEEWFQQDVNLVQNITVQPLTAELQSDSEKDVVISALSGMLDIQRNCVHEGFGINDYMLGMYNGLALALSVVTGKEPEWYTDIGNINDIADSIISGMQDGVNEQCELPTFLKDAIENLKKGGNATMSDIDEMVKTMQADVPEYDDSEEEEYEEDEE